MIRKHKNGFTLVELLAVIVILAIILVIAVPQIMKTIDNAREGAFASSAKLIAASAEREYLVRKTLGDTSFEALENIPCEDVVEKTDDYEECEITFNDGKATVILEGDGKFKGKYVCNGTRTEAKVTEDACGLVCEVGMSKRKVANAVKPYEIKNIESCESFFLSELKDVPSQEIIDDFIQICNSEGDSFSEDIEDFVSRKVVSEQLLIENNVIKGTTTEECTTIENCFVYESSNGEEENTDVYITGYNYECGPNVVVPENINGNKVTGIGEMVFYNAYIKSINLPSTIEYIGEGAFSGYEQVYASINHPYLEGELDLSNLERLTNISMYAFSNNSITTVKLPQNISEIGEYAFDSNPITKIVNPSGKVFDWYEITGKGSSSTCTFAEGICEDLVVVSAE